MKKVFVDKFILIFSLFIVGSVIGFLHENIFAMIKGQQGIRQGLIYGPFIPVYGVGLLLFYLLYSHIEVDKRSKVVELLIIFIIGFIMGGFTEYMCSYLQEVFMGTKSWDYSNVRFNLHGRTSLFHATSWGAMSILFYQFVLPVLNKTKKFFDNKKFRAIVIFISIFVIIDCIISIFACLRQTERRKNIQPRNKIEEMLDKYYPDDFLNKIYNNAVIVEKNS